MISAHRLFTIVASLALVGCTDPAFKQLGASILSQTGYISSTQAEGIFTAGDKLAKSQTALTAEQEYYLGRAVAANILGKFEPLSQAELIRYVNKVGLAVASVSDVPETFGGYHFVVIDSPTINAMSAPGGFIFVSSAFVRALPDEDSLAAVLAHGVAHVIKRHGVNAISNAELFSALSGITKQGIDIASSRTSSPVDLAPLTDAFSDSVSGVMDKLLTKGFDRKQEYEADVYAAHLLEQAGYDPGALERVLKILQQSTLKDEGGWYATHPSPDDRIDELKGKVGGSTAVSPVRTERFKAVIASL